MIPVRHPLTVYEGTTLELVLRFKDCFRNIIDLSGYTALMQVRPTRSSSTVIVELSTENGGIEVNGPLGKVTIFIEDVEIASGVYDLLLIAPSGKKYRPIKESTFRVVQGVTHDD